MNRDYGNARYTTCSVDDRKQGSAGLLELYRELNGKRDRVARILFWDSCGQFFFESFNSELPLDVVGDFIAETKAAIKTR